MYFGSSSETFKPPDAYAGAGSPERAVPLADLAPGARALLAIDRNDLASLITAAVSVYAAGGSLVVCLDADPETVARRALSERATRVLA